MGSFMVVRVLSAAQNNTAAQRSWWSRRGARLESGDSRYSVDAAKPLSAFAQLSWIVSLGCLSGSVGRDLRRVIRLERDKTGEHKPLALQHHLRRRDGYRIHHRLAPLFRDNSRRAR